MLINVLIYAFRGVCCVKKIKNETPESSSLQISLQQQWREIIMFLWGFYFENSSKIYEQIFTVWDHETSAHFTLYRVHVTKGLWGQEVESFHVELLSIEQKKNKPYFVL